VSVTELTDNPTVSVLLPCHDAQRFLPAALDSLLGQSYRDLEILAVDDGSIDATLEILDAYARREARMRVLSNRSHQGLIRTLNRAVGEATGQFIARLDADDVAAPERIERQVAALVRRPDIGVIGTAVVMLGEDGRRRPHAVWCREPGGARFACLLVTPMVHTTILARASIMRDHPYADASDSLHTEDYELFSRMLEAGINLANLDEALVTVRVRSDGVSLSHEGLQIANFVTCSRRHLERTLGAGPEPSVHRVMVNRMDRMTTAGDLRDGLRWLDRIEQEYAKGEPDCADEIRAAADSQRVDILIQAVLKGRSRLRAAAAERALYYRRQLLSPAARHYFRAKF
jgi:glycosyltransferase involved in cell wall biosynthesis